MNLAKFYCKSKYFYPKTTSAISSIKSFTDNKFLHLEQFLVTEALI